MKNFKNLEERIIKFKRISSDGEEVNREAEIRRMISEGGEPRSITVRLANPVNTMADFDFDMATQQFKGVPRSPDMNLSRSKILDLSQRL